MTRVPDFDELVGVDLPAEERARLRGVHELLVRAGPPPEISPELDFPDMTVTFRGRKAPSWRRRAVLLAAAVVVLLLAFFGGYTAGNESSPAYARTLKLHGTAAAPNALAVLKLEQGDNAGNAPMELAVTGLPKLPGRDYYAVFMMRGGKVIAPCGWFVSNGTGVTVQLNAPYRVHGGDTWIVTRQKAGVRRPGPVVLAQNA